jgi:hypothetical protein
VQLYVENLLKVLKVLKTVIKGSPASEPKKLRHALRTAHRAYRMTSKKSLKNLLTKEEICGIMQTKREVRNMRTKSMNHLSTKALEKLYQYGCYETAKYRYSYDYDEDKIHRIEKKMLGTTEALDPENWVEQ